MKNSHTVAVAWSNCILIVATESNHYLYCNSQFGENSSRRSTMDEPWEIRSGKVLWPEEQCLQRQPQSDSFLGWQKVLPRAVTSRKGTLPVLRWNAQEVPLQIVWWRQFKGGRRQKRLAGVQSSSQISSPFGKKMTNIFSWKVLFEFKMFTKI